VSWRIAEPPPVAYALLPGPRTLAWLLLRRPSELDEEEHAVLQQLALRNPEFNITRHLVQDFMRMVRERCGRKLEKWVGQTQAKGPPRTSRFQPQSPPRLGRGPRWIDPTLELRVCGRSREQAQSNQTADVRAGKVRAAPQTRTLAT
jgi:hypothetical protein